MRRFLVKILLFSFPLLVALYPLDLFFSHLLRQSNAYRGEFEVMNDILDGDAACDIAIYGSSRAWVHFHPGILHDSMKMTVFNFGIDGHNFWLQYMRHVEFLKYNPQPKIIILSVDIYTLQKRKDLYQMEQFLPTCCGTETCMSIHGRMRDTQRRIISSLSSDTAGKQVR